MGPLDPMHIAEGSRLEDFGFRFGEVTNYDDFSQPECLILDPMNSGDALFMIGDRGRFGNQVHFADHETGNIIEFSADLAGSIQNAH